MRRLLLHDSALDGLARIGARFTRYRVPYAVIGGFATAVHIPRRPVDDLDVVIGTGVDAGRRAYKVIGSMAVDRAFGIDPTHALGNPQVLADGDQLIVPTSLGTLHILGLHLPSGVDRDGVINRRKWVLVGHRMVAICDLWDLIAIKSAARHGRDREDVAALQALAAVDMTRNQSAPTTRRRRFSG